MKTIQGNFLIQSDSPGFMTGHQLFTSKVKALEAFKTEWLIEGTVQLLQGSFKMDPSGCVHSFGKSYVLATEEFEDHSMCECCKKHVPTYKLAEHLDSSDGNVYEMCPACRQFHLNEFEKELEEYED